MDELFREVKAFKGGDVGIQVDIFGNCYVHRAVPVSDEVSHLPVYMSRQSDLKKIDSKPEIINENSLICVHA
jgi:hypothetical protein